MNPDRGEELWMKDGRMEDITGPAMVIGNEQSARNQINLSGVVCKDTPVLAKFAGSGKEIAAPGAIYRVEEFSHGLRVAGGGVFVCGEPGSCRTVCEVCPGCFAGFGCASRI